MSGAPFRDAHLVALGLGDLVEPASEGRRFSSTTLLRVIAAADPLAAASLADANRRVRGERSVTHPWTLRVRAPGIDADAEGASRVSHGIADLDGAPATECEIVGALPADARLSLAVEIVRSVRVARPDLTARGFTAREILGVADTERLSCRDVLDRLRAAGLATLSWRPGCGQDPAEIAVHRAAHDAGMPTAVPLGYRRGDVGEAFVRRAGAIADLAASGGGVLSVVVLPDRSEGASPLEGTAGTEDWTACAVARLATFGAVPHVTIDWHATGHKMGGPLLGAGADDVVAAQAAKSWAPVTDDGPRPLQSDRTRALLIEARRSPLLRDALFHPLAAPSAGGAASPDHS